jgi:hypothetical protein
MGDGLIVRTFGSGIQTLAPTITEVSTDIGEINFTITNNDTETAVILYETNDTLPDKNSIQLAGGATSDTITISSLAVSPAILYASANVVGKVKSNITEKSFTFTPAIYTAATGGTTLEYDDGGKRYKSHTFTSNGTFEVTTVGNDDRNQVDYLIIGGGGSGGTSCASGSGGGGAGGYITTLGNTPGGANPSKKIVNTQNYSITIGSGGPRNSGGLGNPSSFDNINAFGGGRGNFDPGQVSVGSGGGASGAGSFTTGTIGQGNNGGENEESRAGGGGGAGGAGSSATASPNKAGDGGNGLANLLRTGSNETRAGGGGGGNLTTFDVNARGFGGLGGGGNGSPRGNDSEGGDDGVTNTGSGGGGNAGAPSPFAFCGRGPGAGGSGIVIIRYEIEPSV